MDAEEPLSRRLERKERLRGFPGAVPGESLKSRLLTAVLSSPARPAASFLPHTQAGRRDRSRAGDTPAPGPLQGAPTPPLAGGALGTPARPALRDVPRPCASRDREGPGRGAGPRAGSPHPAGAHGDAGSSRSGRGTWKDSFPSQERGPPAPGRVTSPDSCKGGGFSARSPGPATPPPSGIPTDMHGAGGRSRPARTYWPPGSLSQSCKSLLKRRNVRGRFSGACTRRRVGVMCRGDVFSHSHLSPSIPGSPVSPLPPRVWSGWVQQSGLWAAPRRRLCEWRIGVADSSSPASASI